MAKYWLLEKEKGEQIKFLSEIKNLWKGLNQEVMFVLLSNIT